MEKSIPKGTEVLIFKYVREWGLNQDDEHFILGVVQSSKKSDDLSCHGSPWYEQIYEVLGEDGNKYIGTYGKGLIGNSFFRTREDHIEALKRKISSNNESILILQEKNTEYNNQINLLMSECKTNNLEKQDETSSPIITSGETKGFIDIHQNRQTPVKEYVKSLNKSKSSLRKDLK